MRDLLKLLGKYKILITFLVLQGISFFLIYSYNSFQKATILSTTNSLVGSTLKRTSNINEYFDLRDINEALISENTELMETSKYGFKKLDDKFAIIDDSLWQKQYRFSPANVVQLSLFNKNNYITLDKGTTTSVEEGMGVLSSLGVVGKVVKCTENYSIVMPIIHSKFSVNVIEKRTGSAGLLSWENEDDYRHARILNITKDTPLKEGDEFITRNGSPLFPGAMKIGVIEEIQTNPGDNFHQIRLKLTTDFSKLKKVTLVYNIFKPELDSLDEAIKKYE